MVRNVGLLSLTQSELSEYCRNCVTTVGSVVSELSDCVGARTNGRHRQSGQPTKRVTGHRRV